MPVSGLEGPALFATRRELVSVPIHALIQYRHSLAGGLGIQVEAGGGVNTSIEHVSLTSAGESLLRIGGYQQSLSSLAGAGVSYRLSRDWALTLGGTFEQVFTDDGDIWSKRDDPKFYSGTLGVRYPRE